MKRKINQLYFNYIFFSFLRLSGVGNGNPHQYSCLANPRDRGAWRATVGRIAELDTTKATEHTMTFVSDNSPSDLKVAEGLWLCPSH